MRQTAAGDRRGEGTGGGRGQEGTGGGRGQRGGQLQEGGSLMGL